eukprot:TRINITY_DN2057_c0_g1_i1.p1 TRINITY_DN2057_c0_g1~~TRINITY_DN2057_c0_g1_i1.p1  ORF type:complete len:130 (-),score=25.51 TRINITY_DN2057_c0_g1_i1:51-440(-)
MTRHTTTLLICILLLMTSIYATPSEEEIMHLAETLDKSCDEYCMNRIKDQQGCIIFCEFMDHVKKHDMHDIHALFVKAGRDSKTMQWAMDDTVAWKFQTKVDDDHDVADFFMDSVRKWIQYTMSHKTEL